MLDNFYSHDVLSPHYDFVPDAPGQYRFPGPGATAAATIAAVRGFPVNDSPGVFGLHSNADTAVALRDTSQVRCRLPAAAPCAMWQHASSRPHIDVVATAH